MEYTFCPDESCGLPAEVVDEFDLPSTEGLVHHVVTRCVGLHRYTQYYPD